jgi:hypothetical protein
LFVSKLALLALAEDRARWPADARHQLSQPDISCHRRALLLLRAEHSAEAEALLLSQSAADPASDDLQAELLCQLRLQHGDASSSEALLQCHCPKPDPARQGWWHCHQQLAQLQLRHQDVLELGLPPEPHPLLRLQLAGAALWLDQPQLAEQQLSQLPARFDAPELQEVRARAHLVRGQNQAALAQLEPLLERTQGSALAWEMAIHLMQALDQALPAATMLNRSLVAHPRHARLHARQSLRQLRTRRPSLARRHVLLQRLHATAGMVKSDQLLSDVNLCTTYEHCGRSDLLPFQHQSLQGQFADSPLGLPNKALTLASLAHPGYPAALAQLTASLPSLTAASPAKPLIPPGAAGTLRLGLIGPDFNYHPVGRFVAMLLSQGLGLGGELHVVATAGRVDTTTRLIEDLANQQGQFHGLQAVPDQETFQRLRDLQLDLAIDLAGWTGENSGALFNSRIAPVQINYLGYFASTGIRAMDVWLGDQVLFPEPMQEWHSERIWRLPRCFLAWQPPANLAEGEVDVPAPPPGAAITFGSFNHARKLSAATLRLWGQLLASVPGSRLALKSYTTDDPGTMQLLRRRMLRCGLDPELVLWLPTCPTATEHLRQYGLVDVALDPFPNGGCTTSCEALWMGVPVITLRGDRYVSRMSTAVLQGAGLHQWIATSEADYLAIAQRAALDLTSLRQGRAGLRAQLQASELGDAAGLNRALWQAFAAMPAALKSP